MKTRSTTNHSNRVESEKTKYCVDIDFDEAITEWNKNKRRVGQNYIYICGKICKTGFPCQRPRPSYPSTNEYCNLHNK
jgi:hypothetical protein